VAAPHQTRPVAFYKGAFGEEAEGRLEPRTLAPQP